jgi:hypothetical protein
LSSKEEGARREQDGRRDDQRKRRRQYCDRDGAMNREKLGPCQGQDRRAREPSGPVKSRPSHRHAETGSPDGDTPDDIAGFGSRSEGGGQEAAAKRDGVNCATIHAGFSSAR